MRAYASTNPAKSKYATDEVGMHHMYAHVIYNARLNENCDSLTGINKVLVHCIVSYRCNITIVILDNSI